jgi:flavin-dependent dehydrogenase
MQADIVIIGGGPAGAAAALTLRRYSARSVIVIERGDYSEVRVGEAIGPSAESLLTYLGVAERFLNDGHRRAHSTAAAWGSEEVVQQHFLFSGRGDGWQLDRNRFDRMLAAAAREAGATVLTGTRVLAVAPHGHFRWHITAQCGQESPLQITASFVIDAAGRSPVIAQKLGAEPQSVDGLIGVTAYIDFDLASTPDSTPDFDPDLDSRFDRELVGRDQGRDQEQEPGYETLVESTPHGWWYSASLPERRLAVAFMSDGDLVRRQGAHTLPGWLDLLAEAPQTRLRVIGGRRPTELHVRSAASHLLRPAGDEGWLAAGDALAAFDPLSSMGIGHALNSGAHAGRVADAALRGDTEPQGQYQTSAEQIMAQYLELRRRYYGMERRWLDHPFWQRRT